MKHRPAKLFMFKSMIKDLKFFSLIMRAICKYAIGIIFLLEFRGSDVSSLKVVGDFCSVYPMICSDNSSCDKIF